MTKGKKRSNAASTKRMKKLTKRRKANTAGVRKAKKGSNSEQRNAKLLAELEMIETARAAEADREVICRLTGRELSERVPPKRIRIQAPQGQTAKEGGHRS